MNILEQYKHYAAANRFDQTPQSLYEPMNYLLALGGKAMRPALLLYACQLFDATKLQAALPAAYAVELFHNFSLMHDDIMDAADLRRGQATVHKKYDTNTALLSGDVMLVYAYEYLAKIPTAQLPQALHRFNQTAIGVCKGQRMDMDFEQTFDISLSDYLLMIELKTAVLLQGAMEIGALIGGATPDEAQLAGEFGRLMGIAFQLQDDFLDTFGKAEKVGKRIGGDIVQNKKTYLLLYTLSQADEADKASLLKWMSQTTEEKQADKKIKEVTKLFKKYQADLQLQALMQDYTQQAAFALAQIPSAEEFKLPLREFLYLLSERES